MRKVLTALAFMAAIVCHATEADYRVVPLPQSINSVKGEPFVLDETRQIVYQGDENMARNARFFADYIAEKTHLSLQVAAADKKNVKGNVLLGIDSKIQEAEGYRIEVSAKGVRVMGSTPAGVFYGIQTLRKSLPLQEAKAAVTLPAALITDAPRFS